MLKRCGRLADDWISYVITPERYTFSLEAIASGYHAEEHPRQAFSTDHVLFICMDTSYEVTYEEYANTSLSHRYAMDFSHATKR